jgi:hypothetical protein
MHFSVAAIFTLLLSTVAALPAPTEESNAQRLARGLPPRAPKFGRNLPGVPQLIDGAATPVGAAKRSTPSSTTGTTTYTGRLLVRFDDPTYGNAGHVRNWSEEDPISGVNFFPNEDLYVSFTVSGSTPFSILATNPVFPAPFYVGATGSTTANYGPSSVLDFTNVPQTAPGAQPGSTGGIESAIWTFDASSQKLTANWVNPDGTTVEADLAYDSRENSLFFAGDIATWEQLHSDYFASAVSIYLDTT